MNRCPSPPDPPATPLPEASAPPRPAVLELRVRNHPGAMSHVTGLFARRAFNLEAILCVPEEGGTTSRILLLVAGGPRLTQIERQLAKLYDVLSIRQREDLGADWFDQLAAGAVAPAGHGG
jgi:acetolactate synthase-1/3 small subunit